MIRAKRAILIGVGDNRIILVNEKILYSEEIKNVLEKERARTEQDRHRSL
jgi:hypothetical protein